eukprot:Gb_04595 [translate_table: standard]
MALVLFVCFSQCIAPLCTAIDRVRARARGDSGGGGGGCNPSRWFLNILFNSSGRSVGRFGGSLLSTLKLQGLAPWDGFYGSNLEINVVEEIQFYMRYIVFVPYNALRHMFTYNKMLLPQRKAEEAWRSNLIPSVLSWVMSVLYAVHYVILKYVVSVIRTEVHDWKHLMVEYPAP